MAENNNKKRIGRRTTILGIAIGLIQIAFYFCIFTVAKDKPELIPKLFLYNILATSLIAGILSGVLTITDVKEIIDKQ